MKWITVANLSEELGVNRANMFKLLKKMKIATLRQRDPTRKNQVVSVVTEEQANKVRDYRKEFGLVTAPAEGSFYFISLSKTRVKFGYTVNLASRIRALRTSCPDLKVLRVWKCESVFEPTIIAMVIRPGDKKISSEVYELRSLSATIARLSRVFRFLPNCTLQNSA